MKLYLLTSDNHQRYAGSMAEVRSAKTEMTATYQVKKSAITVETVEVKTGKKDLLNLLNELCIKGEQHE